MTKEALVAHWPKIAYAVLGAVLAVATAISTNAVAVPPGLKDVAPYAGVLVVFLGMLIPNIFDRRDPPA